MLNRGEVYLKRILRSGIRHQAGRNQNAALSQILEEYILILCYCVIHPNAPLIVIVGFARIGKYIIRLHRERRARQIILQKSLRDWIHSVDRDCVIIEGDSLTCHTEVTLRIVDSGG